MTIHLDAGPHMGPDSGGCVMEIIVNGHKTFCYAGGKAYDAAKPTAVFVHGVLNDHSVWILQTRYLAHHGWNVLAPDLPGHGKSAGPAPATVQEAAPQGVISYLRRLYYDTAIATSRPTLQALFEFVEPTQVLFGGQVMSRQVV